MKTITDENYVDRAETVIKNLVNKTNPRTGRKIPLVTTSKLRNLLAMTADIYNEAVGIRTEELPKSITSRIEYLRIRFIYEAGRDEQVKNLVTESKVLDIFKEINNQKSNYILFSRYMEALVAFRKFYDSHDD